MSSAMRACAVAAMLLLAHRAGADSEDDALRCWLRSSAGAIRVGEPFSLVVTCQATETDALAVIVDESKLDPASVQFPPFDVLRGARAAELRAPGLRFFQYEYSLRLVNDLWFDRDIPLPDLNLTYRLKTSTGSGEAILGIERTYMLPREFLHVASLVPDGASDIRDTTDATFRENEAAAFRADALVSTGIAAATLGGAFALAGLVRLAGGRRARAGRPLRPLPPRAILRGVTYELQALRRAREEGGWTAALVSRALAAWRVGATIMSGRAAAQRAADKADASDGALVLRRGWWKPEAVVVSGHVTASTTAGRDRSGAGGAGAAGTMSGSDRADIQHALATFTTASYGSGTVADEVLDEAFAAGERAVQAAGRQQRWPASALRRLRRPEALG